MDPRTPMKTEEETVRSPSTSGAPSVRRKVITSPTQRTEEVQTITHAGGEEAIRKSQTVGASAAYAAEYSRKKMLYQIYRVVWYLLGFVEIFLVARFFLKVLGANPASGFATFVYGVSKPFAQPFINVFSPTTGQGAETVGVVEWSTLIGMFVYVLIVWGIERLLNFARPINPEEVERDVAQS